MATFVVSYDAHKVRDYTRFYEAAADNNGLPLLDSMWAFEFEDTAANVRDWVASLFDDDDSIVVIQLKPRVSWATRKAPEAATWFKKHFG